MKSPNYDKKIELLDKKIKILRWDKKKAINFVEEQEERFQKNEISKKEYDNLIRKRLYNLSFASYVKQNNETLRKALKFKNSYEKKRKETSTLKIGFVAILLIFTAYFIFSEYEGITGFVIGPQAELVEEDVNLFFNESASYTLILEDNIDSFLISGSFTGNVKVYLNDKSNLVFDSDLSSAGITGITGMVISELQNSNETPETIGNVTSENQPVSLVIPDFFSLGLEDSISFDIVNEHDESLSDITLSASSSFENVILSFEQAYFSTMEVGGSRTVVLNIGAEHSANFTIEISVNVGNPEFNLQETIDVEVNGVVEEIIEEINFIEENVSEIVNISEEVNVTENVTEEVNVTEEINVTPEINITENVTQEINVTPEINVSENITIELNLTEEVNVTPERNVTENVTQEVNITEEINVTPEINVSENVTEEVNVTTEVNVSQNITEEVNVTPGINVTEEVNVPLETTFENECVDTCLLDNVDKNITLIIEIGNGTLNLTSISYKRHIEEVVVKKERNVSDIFKEDVLSREYAKDLKLKEIKKANDKYRLTLEFNLNDKVGEIDVRDIENISKLKNIQTGKINKSFIKTTALAFNEIDFSKADIKLPKEGTVNKILKCEFWNFEKFRCGNWKVVDIGFTQDDDFVYLDINESAALVGAFIETNEDNYTIRGAEDIYQRKNCIGCEEKAEYNPIQFCPMTNKSKNRDDFIVDISFDVSDISGSVDFAEVCAYQYYSWGDYDDLCYASTVYTSDDEAIEALEKSGNEKTFSAFENNQWNCIDVTSFVQDAIDNEYSFAYIRWIGPDLNGTGGPYSCYKGFDELRKCDYYNPSGAEDCRPFIRIVK